MSTRRSKRDAPSASSVEKDDPEVEFIKAAVELIRRGTNPEESPGANFCPRCGSATCPALLSERYSGRNHRNARCFIPESVRALLCKSTEPVLRLWVDGSPKIVRLPTADEKSLDAKRWFEFFPRLCAHGVHDHTAESIWESARQCFPRESEADEFAYRLLYESFVQLKLCRTAPTKTEQRDQDDRVLKATTRLLEELRRHRFRPDLEQVETWRGLQDRQSPLLGDVLVALVENMREALSANDYAAPRVSMPAASFRDAMFGFLLGHLGHERRREILKIGHGLMLTAFPQHSVTYRASDKALLAIINRNPGLDKSPDLGSRERPRS